MLTTEPSANSALESFIEALGQEQVTISIQKDRDSVVIPSGGAYFSNRNRSRLVGKDTLATPDFQKELQFFNGVGCGIYFTPNQGNGIPEDDTTNCHKISNIIKLNALLIDTDAADIKELVKILESIKFYPHYSVNTSPGRHHLYFLIEPTEVSPESRMYWESIQKYLCSLVPGLDQSIVKINQLLRLPGYFHMKRDPYRIQIKIRKNFPKYNLKELYSILGADKFNPYSDNHFQINGTYEAKPKYDLPKERIGEGGRHAELLSFCNFIAENHLNLQSPDEMYEALLKEHIQKYFINPEEFLTGSRSQEISKIIRDVKTKRIRELNKKEVLKFNRQVEEVEDSSEKDLPDEFYLQFPGDLGLITRQIHKCYPNLSLELCFASSLCVSGALKADVFRCKSAWPFINGFVLATTGGGKSTVKKVIEDICGEAGLTGKYSQVIQYANSVQALHYDLYRAGGVGTVIVDEAGDYLQAMLHKNAPGYHRMNKAYIKNATSSSSKEGVFLSPGRSKSNEDPPFIGMLSCWMFSQPSMFYAAIDINSMNDGFIPRFFVFKGENKFDFTSYVEERTGTLNVLSPDVLAVIEGINALKHKVTEEQSSEIKDKIIAEGKEKKLKLTDKQVESKRLAELYDLKYQARMMSIKEVALTEDAKKAIVDYLTEESASTKSKREEKGDGSPEEAMMVRSEEMVLRLICNAASWDGNELVCDEYLALQCIRFYKFQRTRFLAKEALELYKGHTEKQEDLVYKALMLACKSKQDAVTLSDIKVRITKSKRPDNLFKLLLAMSQNGRVSMEQRIHESTKRKYFVYMPLEM